MCKGRSSMSQGSRARLRSGMLVPIAMIVGIAIAGAARATNSELERELQRELHRMPPPALLPTPATLACYERLAKISHYAPLPIQSEPAQCATVDLVRLDRVTDARPDASGGQPAGGAPVQHGRGGGAVHARRRRPRRRRARRAACGGHRPRFHTSAAAATASPAPSCRSTARATRSTSAPSSFATARCST